MFEKLRWDPILSKRHVVIETVQGIYDILSYRLAIVRPLFQNNRQIENMIFLDKPLVRLCPTCKDLRVKVISRSVEGLMKFPRFVGRRSISSSVVPCNSQFNVKTASSPTFVSQHSLTQNFTSLFAIWRSVSLCSLAWFLQE